MVVNADASEKKREQVLSLNPPSGCELHAPLCLCASLWLFSRSLFNRLVTLLAWIGSYVNIHIYISNASLLGERKAKAHVNEVLK